MRRLNKSQLTRRDVYVTDITISDQIHRLDYVTVASRMPFDVLVILVRDGNELELWLRGPKASVENARYFIEGWRTCLRIASPHEAEIAQDTETLNTSLRNVAEQPRVRPAKKKTARKK